MGRPIDDRAGVAIAEVIVYFPCLAASIYLCTRHGFKKVDGWIYTIIFCVIRLVGAILLLASYSNNSEGLLTTSIVLSSVGLSPLLFATLGLLSRFASWTNLQHWQYHTRRGASVNAPLRLTQLALFIGLILSIVGGTSTSVSADGHVSVQTTSKIVIILFVVAYVAILAMLLVSCASMADVPRGERRVALAVALAAPFLAARLLFSVLSLLTHMRTFSLVGGSLGVQVGMAVVEEFVVVVIYLSMGFTLQRFNPEQQRDAAARLSSDARLAEGSQGSTSKV